jgi:anti-anti-sigma factor
MAVNGSGVSRAWGLAGSITVEHERDEVVLCLAGEVDQFVVQEFDRATDGRAPAVDVIDAGAATFLASAGIGLLLRVRESSAASGRSGVLRAASPQVDRLLTLVGVADLLRRPASP